MPVLLSAQLVHQFPPNVRLRGEDYHRDGRVTIVETEPGFALAEVEGQDTYDVAIRWGDEVQWSAACTCPAFEERGPCKHLWALVLALDEGSSSAALSRERRVDAAARAAGTTDAATRGAQAPGSRAETWNARLAELHRLSAHARRDPWAAAKSESSRIEYVIGPEKTFDAHELVLHVHARKRLKNGKWGARKRFDPWAAKSAPAEDPLDRTILGNLPKDLRSAFLAYVTAPNTGRFQLNKPQIDLLLPLLCQTGRFFWEASDGSSAEPLEWDGGGAWVLGFELARNEAKRHSVLDGFLARDAERMPLAEVSMIISGEFIVARNRVARFDARDAMAMCFALRTHGPIIVPVEREPELLQSLIEAPGSPLCVARGLRQETGIAPRPHLLVESPSSRGRAHGMLECHISFDYGETRVRASDARGNVRVPSSVSGEAAFVTRNRELEHFALRQFVDCGGEADLRSDAPSDGTVDAARLPAVVARLIGAGWTVDAEGVPYRRAGRVTASVRSGIDWFELDGAVDFEGERASLPALIAAAKKGERTVRLADGSLGVLPERWLEQWGLVDAIGEVHGESLRFKKNQGWILDALLASRPEVEFDKKFAEFTRRLAAFQKITAQDEPASFQGHLRGYQREGLGWFAFLRDMNLGGCLADDMGLGKTVQVLALFEARRLSSTKHAPSLVVAPKSVVFNWLEEARHFTPKLRVMEYSGGDRKKKLADFAAQDVVVTTYGALRKDVLDLKEQRFDYVVLDEAQTIKNVHSQAAKAARLLHAEHRLALSGTPIENHIGELWSLFEFLNPGLLGRAAAFKDVIGASGPEGPDPHTVAALSHALKPFFLRRRKEDVLADLPEKSEQILYCDLEGRQRDDYADLREHYRRSLLHGPDVDAVDPEAFHVLEALLRLRQAACHPGLIDVARASESSAKLEVLLAHLEEVVESGHKALVFSQFTSFLAILRQRLDAQGVVYEYLDGQTKKRQECVERFQRDEACPLFLISLKAGGFGLNLTAADYVFLMDPWWNPAAEMQAIDRTHRIGQTKKVMAYRLIARDTVEERVLELQAKKRVLVEQVLGGQGTRLGDLSRADLERLLS